MTTNKKNTHELMAMTISRFRGMFPHMEAITHEVALLYTNEMKLAFELNDNISESDIANSINRMNTGGYTSQYAPSIPEFISICLEDKK